MGQAKEWLPIGEEALLQRVVRVVGEVANPIVVAARRGQDLPEMGVGVEVVFDAVEDQGPLAGVAAGLEALVDRCRAAVVVSCDHPLIRRGVIERLMAALGEAMAVVVEHEGETYPLVGVYRVEVLATLGELLDRGERRARRFAEACGAAVLGGEALREVDPRLDSLRNVNDQESYQAALAVLQMNQ